VSKRNCSRYPRVPAKFWDRHPDPAWPVGIIWSGATGTKPAGIFGGLPVPTRGWSALVVCPTKHQSDIDDILDMLCKPVKVVRTSTRQEVCIFIFICFCLLFEVRSVHISLQTYYLHERLIAITSNLHLGKTVQTGISVAPATAYGYNEGLDRRTGRSGASIEQWLWNGSENVSTTSATHLHASFASYQSSRWVFPVFQLRILSQFLGQFNQHAKSLHFVFAALAHKNAGESRQYSSASNLYGFAIDTFPQVYLLSPPLYTNRPLARLKIGKCTRCTR